MPLKNFAVGKSHALFGYIGITAMTAAHDG
jgi:hypothetical protein